MFCHNPNKEQQNWSVEDAVAHKGGAAQDMKFQCPSEGKANFTGCKTDKTSGVWQIAPPPPLLRLETESPPPPDKTILI